MGSSFQEQLLKLGLVDKDKVKKAKKSQYKKRNAKVGKKQPAPVDENAILAEKALAKKKERARQFNLEREEKLKKREQDARVRQLIESSRLAKDEQGVAYRFVDNKKVYRIFISAEVIDQLSKGRVGIVRLGEHYEVCPAAAILSIRELEPKLVIVFNEPESKEKGEDGDPYAGFEVPDDLMW